MFPSISSIFVLFFFFSQIASDLQNNKYKHTPHSDCQEYLL